MLALPVPKALDVLGGRMIMNFCFLIVGCMYSGEGMGHFLEKDPV